MNYQKIRSIVFSAIFTAGTFSLAHAQDWSTSGNSLSTTGVLGTSTNQQIDFKTNNLTRLTIQKNGYLGLGIAQPRAWQEIQYCPPSGTDEAGLVVTKFNCTSGGTSPWIGTDPDLIGNGLVVYENSGREENQNVVFQVPFSFLTGHTTNANSPMYTSEEPMFWVRKELPPSGAPGASPITEFQSKFIVMPDGSCGINITQPRAALDVRGSQGYNRPAAIIGARAIGTHHQTASGLNQYYTQQIHFVPKLFENGYNQIVHKDDQGLFFSDGQGIDGSNQSGSFVIAPWAESGNPVIGGIRIDAAGNTEVHGTLRATKFNVDAVWWSDFVFKPNYSLMQLSELGTYIKTNGHLPNVPSEKEVLNEGVDVASMFAVQQQKIEELTLYILQLHKRLESLETE